MNNPSVISLPTEMSINVIEELCGVVKEAFSAHAQLEIDASAVERVDTAGIQLLVALSVGAERGGKTLTFKDAGPTLRNTAYLLGVENQLFRV